MITGASATSRIRIIPEKADAIYLTAERAALWLNWRLLSLTLLSYSYCITGIPEPADT